MTSTPVLHVRSVVKIFHQGAVNIHALDGAELTVHAGEFVAIMGASGSGKSTLLHAIAGLTRLDSGTVILNGQDLADLSDARLTGFRRRHIGLVFQAFNLVPVLNAEDNVRLPAEPHPGLNAQVDELFARLEISARRTHKPDALSGGEQQRVAIARALITDPDLLLADEPTGSVDSIAGQEICRLLRNLCDEQRRTIIVVTHEPTVAMWADRAVVLKDGRNQAEFTIARQNPEAVAAAYHHAVQTSESHP